ncbi:MAG: M28 family peptidase [Verrucomicrobiota bacterium]
MIRYFLILSLAFGSIALASAQEKTESPAEQESALLSSTRQLTFEGKRSGEGYFSADGSKMIFQSEREEENPFYQIYLLDLETGDTEMVSPGHGKTTCAWIHPDGTKVMFASTQLDKEAKAKQQAELDFRESGKQRRYSWDYDETFDLIEYDLETKEYYQITKAKGYDAEGAYSPDGKQIVFASNRQAYEGDLSEEDAKFFKLDKKFLMELYICDADGSNVKRLTHTDGYDGGPFFNATGSKVCWRRFDRKGMTAEIFTMNTDGSEELQLTTIGAMSWAPYFHPSDEYLIFATNKHGFANFELYLVRADGKGDPVRVTYTDGFDGLPVFSPDGKQLSWTSKRNAANQSQIYLSKWNHEAARSLLGLDKEASAPQSDLTDISAPTPETTASITVDDMKAHIEYLASPELEGRLTGTKGEHLATAYVANAFKNLGLKMGGDNYESYYQQFPFTAGVDLGPDNKLNLEIGTDVLNPTADEDWRPLTFSKTGEVADSNIVFAGYGLELPENKYSSYFHLDVKGKWVMVFRFYPEDADDELKQELRRFSRNRHKASLARRKFAAGIIFVTGPETEVNDELIPLEFDASLADSGIPAISISNELASKIFAANGKDLAEVHKSLVGGEMVQGFPLKGAKLGGQIDIVQEKKMGRNVIGILDSGQDGPHPAPAVVIGAHIDHLGATAGRGSLATSEEKSEIHFGADDNASGTAAMMEIAEYLADQVEQGKIELTRDVVFAAWSGEEIGLLGSSHFVQKLAKDVWGDANAPLSMILSSYLNMDMVGRLKDNLVLQGVGSSDYWTGAIERRNAPIGLPITTQKDTYLPTDATNFYLRKVPILNAFTGSHPDYHTPRDTPDKVNYEGAKDVARLMGLITRELATNKTAPKYVRVDPPKNRGARGFRVYLGTIPDYSQGDLKGVKLSGVAENGPASKAGVQGGDIIIGLGDREILNIYDYTDALAGLKVGEETTITVKRGDKDIKMKLVPGSRD